MRDFSRFQSLVDNDVCTMPDINAVHELLRLADAEEIPSVELVVALALAVGAGRDGNSCVDLDTLQKLPKIKGFTWPSTADATAGLVAVSNVVRKSTDFESTARQPFVLDKGRLYVARAYEEERAVVAHLVRLHANKKLSVILGGPGTGKTTYISGELIKMFAADETDSISLSLVAPTGKAARRMKQSLMRALAKSDAPQEVVAKILHAAEARTVHRLLEMSPRRTPRYRFNSDPESRLACNLLIVDEASMMSLSLMYHLLEALEDGAEVWLVGDPDQLASVDAGTVLGDIAQVTVPANGRFHDAYVPRTKQHRYPENSHINRLVTCVRDNKTAEDVELFMQILAEKTPDVSWINPKTQQNELQDLIAEVIDNAKAVAQLAEAGQSQLALEKLASVQVLCAHREGAMGVAGWNRLVQRGIPGSSSHPFYFGRPVMITKNDDSLQLANGDVGVVCNLGGIRKVAFEGVDGALEISVNSLPAVETVHGLTIHKSQGSEYTHAIVVLPTHHSRILTRELVYTAISRPTERLTIVASPDVLRHAIENPIRRSTGLAETLRAD